ncbi:MAG: endonuclease/exonuclease/phosphatase family protein [Rudaea sp.]|uniref:endonuclease/exonuclease/phosphatase family protein n=1 Tax=Rudaea sp. TaxID=2136325 RepID=UPI0039E5A002
MSAIADHLAEKSVAGSRLRLLSCNILAGGSVRKYRHYVTEGWKQVLPVRSKRANLDSLAALLADFDVVGLQEADAGSLRSGFLNQTEYLAEGAGFPYWSHQPNRKIAQFAASSNGLLARLRPAEVRDYALPSRIPGRGAMWVRFDLGGEELIIVVVHLSLGAQARARQLDFIADLIWSSPHVVLMGDFNCALDSAGMSRLLRRTGLVPAHDAPPPTFPSWRPRRAIDHILVSERMEIENLYTLPHIVSDHLPLAAEILLPAPLRLSRAQSGAR